MPALAITWRRDYPGASRVVCRLGAMPVGAVIAEGKSAQWIEWLPSSHGAANSIWRTVREGEAGARLALVNHLRGWLARAGITDVTFEQVEAAPEITGGKPQPRCDVGLFDDVARDQLLMKL